MDMDLNMGMNMDINMSMNTKMNVDMNEVIKLIASSLLNIDFDKIFASSLLT